MGGTTWSAIVTDAACLEIAGLVYYDEMFDAATGYLAGDSIRITFKNQKVTVAANDHELIGATGRIFYTSIRASIRGSTAPSQTPAGSSMRRSARGPRLPKWRPSWPRMTARPKPRWTPASLP